jgi:hypothetical protein
VLSGSASAKRRASISRRPDPTSNSGGALHPLRSTFDNTQLIIYRWRWELETPRWDPIV